MTHSRCFVPECDSENTKFDDDWVKDILPGTTPSSGIFQPELCSKFIFTGDRNATHSNETCQAHWFGNEEERCNQWVFDESERTIVNDVWIERIFNIFS